MEIIAARTLNSLYVYLDVIWLLIFAAVLLWRRRYLAFITGIIGGAIYFTVDYGVFYFILHTRIVEGANPFWFLLWLSMSYGFTNFAWIWLLLDRDGKSVEWSLLIIIAWVTIALASQCFGSGFHEIAIQRGTLSYHGVMALLMAFGYGYLILHNLREPTNKTANLMWLIAIGVGVQFSWEFILLLSGIRPTNILPLIVNSLIETNLGIPYLYLLHAAISNRYTEDLKSK